MTGQAVKTTPQHRDRAGVGALAPARLAQLTVPLGQVGVGLLVGPVGTCNALTFGPRAWSDLEARAIRACATMLAQLIGSASDARHKGELAASCSWPSIRGW